MDGSEPQQRIQVEGVTPSACTPAVVIEIVHELRTVVEEAEHRARINKFKVVKSLRWLCSWRSWALRCTSLQGAS